MKNTDSFEDICPDFNVEQENKNWEELLKIINIRARDIARKDFLENYSPIIYDWPSEIDGLSDLDRDNYENNFVEISLEFEDDANKLFAYANIVLGYVCRLGAAKIRLMLEHGIYPDNEYTRMCSTPEGYIGNERITPDFLVEISGSNANTLIKSIAYVIGFKKQPDDIYIMKALDCIWLKLASEDFSGTEKVFMALAEARMASEIANDLIIINRLDRNNSKEDSIAEIKSSIARRAASARHAKSNKDRILAIEKYKNNRSSYKSKDDAAYALTKDFPYEFATIRSWLKKI